MTNLFLEFLGNNNLKEALRADICRGKLSRALILKGARGSGRRTLARILAAAAVCSNVSRAPCGECVFCRKVREGIHPDVTVIGGEEEITADKVRDARRSLFIRPNEASRRVIIIENAERLNRFAANALLAVLEEPPAEALFIMTVESEASLLATVRSRCAIYRLAPLGEIEIVEALKQRMPEYSADELRRAASDSGGFLGRAIELLVNSEDGEDIAGEFLVALSGKSPRMLAELSEKLSKLKRPEFSAFLNSAKEKVCEALKGSYGMPAEERALDAARRVSASSLLRLSGAIDTMLLHCEYRVGAGHLAGEFLVFCMDAITE